MNSYCMYEAPKTDKREENADEHLRLGSYQAGLPHAHQI